jgi:hypothetical protein
VVDETRAASSNCPLKPNPAEAEVAAAPRPGFAIATAAMTSLASNGMRDGTYTGPATDVVVEVAGHPWLALNQQYLHHKSARC